MGRKNAVRCNKCYRLAGRDRRTLVKVISGLLHARVAGSEVWFVSSRDCGVLSGIISDLLT
jgi:hypothetical protein